MTNTTLTQKILKALQDGPGTSSEIAATLGKDATMVSSLMGNMFRRGEITRISVMNYPGKAGRKEWVYKLCRRIVRCPSCKSGQTVYRRDGARRCNNCGEVFREGKIEKPKPKERTHSGSGQIAGPVYCRGYNWMVNF